MRTRTHSDAAEDDDDAEGFVNADWEAAWLDAIWVAAQAVGWTHSQYAGMALDWIFARPIFNGPDFETSISIPGPTAKRRGALPRDPARYRRRGD